MRDHYKEAKAVFLRLLKIQSQAHGYVDDTVVM